MRKREDPENEVVLPPLDDIFDVISDACLRGCLVRKALYNIVLNQMSPRHISGILYEYPQVTT